MSVVIGLVAVAAVVVSLLGLLYPVLLLGFWVWALGSRVLSVRDLEPTRVHG